MTQSPPSVVRIPKEKDSRGENYLPISLYSTSLRGPALRKCVLALKSASSLTSTTATSSAIKSHYHLQQVHTYTPPSDSLLLIFTLSEMATSKCILNTGNIMTAASDVLRNPAVCKSSTELIISLRSHIRSSPPSPPPSPSLSTPPTKPLLYIPLPPTPEPLAEDRDEYDVTVKLFHLAGSLEASREAHTRDAIQHVLDALAISSIDLLILSLPGISFDAEDTLTDSEGEEEVAGWVRTYRILEALHEAGVIKRLGISEFGTTRLTQLLPHAHVKPSVNQINVRDCCVVPKPLILFAKQEGIDLLTHNDCTDILPADTLRGVLVDEFGLLTEEREVVPQWVVKYTAVIRSRGVVENKGYVGPILLLHGAPD